MAHKTKLNTTHHDRRLARRLEEDPELRAEFERQRREIAQIDSVVRQLDELREQAGMSKAELARAIGKEPSSIPPLFHRRRQSGAEDCRGRRGCPWGGGQGGGEQESPQEAVSAPQSRCRVGLNPEVAVGAASLRPDGVGDRLLQDEGQQGAGRGLLGCLPGED